MVAIEALCLCHTIAVLLPCPALWNTFRVARMPSSSATRWIIQQVSGDPLQLAAPVQSPCLRACMLLECQLHMWGFFLFRSCTVRGFNSKSHVLHFVLFEFASFWQLRTVYCLIKNRAGKKNRKKKRGLLQVRARGGTSSWHCQNVFLSCNYFS